MLQDNASLLVPLAFFSGHFIHPAKFSFAIFAHNVSHHVTTCKHYSILDTTKGQVDDFLEKISTTSRSCESVKYISIKHSPLHIRNAIPCRYQLAFICQVGIALRTSIKLYASNMFQMNSSHCDARKLRDRLKMSQRFLCFDFFRRLRETMLQVTFKFVSS